MPDRSVFFPVVHANVEAIDQGLALIESLTPETYQYRAKPIVASTIGEHFRHILDMYFALIEGLPEQQVDFNRRRRGASVESDLCVAREELQSIRAWLLGLAENDDAPINMISEVTLGDTSTVQIRSSLARELIFTSSHAVHHYALIGVIAKMQDVTVDNSLGLAAATATYQRQISGNIAANG